MTDIKELLVTIEAVKRLTEIATQHSQLLAAIQAELDRMRDRLDRKDTAPGKAS